MEKFRKKRPNKVRKMRQLEQSNHYDYAWRKFSKAFLVENPVCECGKFKVWKDNKYLKLKPENLSSIKVAEHVDHIKPIKKGGLKYAKFNLQALCKSCHSSKTALYDK